MYKIIFLKNFTETVFVTNCITIDIDTRGHWLIPLSSLVFFFLLDYITPRSLSSKQTLKPPSHFCSVGPTLPDMRNRRVGSFVRSFLRTKFDTEIYSRLTDLAAVQDGCSTHPRSLPLFYDQSSERHLHVGSFVLVS